MVFNWLRTKRPSLPQADGGEARELAARQIQAGLKHASDGDWASAAIAFQEAVRDNPDFADAHHNLSIALSNTGDTKAAFAAAQTAAQLSPKEATLFNLGNTAAHVGELDIAAESLTAVLELNPENTACRKNLGLVLHAQERWDSAIHHLSRVQVKDQPSLDVDLPLASIYRRTGNYKNAHDTLNHLIKAHPAQLDSLLELARLLAAKGDRQGALNAIDKALRIDDRSVACMLVKADALHHLGEFEQKEQCLIHALEIAPDHSGARMALAETLVGLERRDEARTQYSEVLAREPENVAALIGLGALNLLEVNYLQALSLLEKGLKLEPQNSTALNLIGRLHFELHDLEKAAHFLERAMKENGTDSSISLNLAQTYLAQGRLAEGWDCYDRPNARIALSWIDPERDWKDQPLNDAVLRIRPEQGIGDEILFSTCYADAIAEAKKCIIECDPRLTSILERTFSSADIVPVSLEDRVAGNFPVYDYDLECLAGSLPGRYRRTHNSFPDTLAALKVSPTLHDKWRTRVGELGETFKIGLCWRSEVITSYRMRNSLYTHMEDWGSILNLPGTSFVNLYYGECEYEIAQAKARFGVDIAQWEDLDLRNDLDDVFALIASLDLVITTQSAVWNMAGAVGQDTIVLFNPNNQLGTSNVPWHKSVEPITTGRFKPWDGVVNDIQLKVQSRMKKWRDLK